MHDGVIVVGVSLSGCPDAAIKYFFSVDFVPIFSSFLLLAHGFMPFPVPRSPSLLNLQNPDNTENYQGKQEG